LAFGSLHLVASAFELELPLPVAFGRVLLQLAQDVQRQGEMRRGQGLEHLGFDGAV
jgi:hypothetical protein